MYNNYMIIEKVSRIIWNNVYIYSRNSFNSSNTC